MAYIWDGKNIISTPSAIIKYYIFSYSDNVPQAYSNLESGRREQNTPYYEGDINDH
jgi:hypothetical protein